MRDPETAKALPTVGRFHWLRHDWGKWEQYEQQYMALLDGERDTAKAVPQRRLCERRRCETCGAMQDRVVRNYHA